MNVRDLLKGVEVCECGKSHPCPIKYVFIGSGVVKSLAESAADYKNILLVADENTYAVGGKQVEDILGERITAKIIFDGSEILVPDERALDEIDRAITDGTDLVLGIGSGVINDLCKASSFKRGLKYQIVATAPSMDGYASVGAALILDGMKVTINAAVPEAIICDTDILATAPMDMILAGYGDIIGKYSCLSDWKLANLVNGEYICPFVVSETYNQVENTRRLASGLLKKDGDALAALASALVAVGILMAYVGNSRPASGSEHHFSHFFEIVGLVKGEEYLPHGIDVFYSAAETALIREKLAKIESVDDVFPAFCEGKYIADIREIYGNVADEVLALQNKLGWYKNISARIEVYKEKWQQIRKLLLDAPSFNDMCDLLCEVGMSYDDFVSYYGKEKIEKAKLYAKDLKDRYTVLWLYFDMFSK